MQALDFPPAVSVGAVEPSSSYSVVSFESQPRYLTGPPARTTRTAPSVGSSGGGGGGPAQPSPRDESRTGVASASGRTGRKPRDERMNTLLTLKEQAMQESVRRGKERYLRKKEEESQKKEDKFHSLVAELEAGNSDLLPSTDMVLQQHQQWRKKKVKDTYEAWKSQVYEPIQRAIKEKTSERSVAEIESRLRGHYDEYLRVTNEKAGVYRDIIIAEDYDPLKARSSNIRVTPKIRDPMKVELTKTMREQLLMGSSDPKGRAGGTGGRDTLDLVWWDRVEATPHGHQVPVRDPPLIPPGMRSAVVFDHFKYPRGEEGQMVADRMYATGAMRRPVEGEARRNVELRRNMFEVVRHEAVGQSVEMMKATGRAQNDLWLSARGKAPLPGPEIRIGRPNLFPVLQVWPANDADRESDLWLSQRGKGRPPGPEERIGRKGLFEVVQPLGREGRNFDPRGDIYLEQIHLKGKRALHQLEQIPGETVYACLSFPQVLQAQAQQGARQEQGENAAGPSGRH